MFRRPWLLLSLLFVMGAQSAFAVELEYASNDQLLRELARRLSIGTGTPATATYTCDSSGYLKTALTGPGGNTTQAKSIYTGSYRNCATQAANLNSYKKIIQALTTIAMCDSSGYLTQIYMRPDGTLTEAGSTYTGSYSNCSEQAKDINGAH